MINKIVVEGPNNVGKTTLINKLKQLDAFKDWDVVHMSEKSPCSYDYFDELFSSDTKMIFDRAHLGEAVYSELYGRPPKMTVDEIMKLTEKYKHNILYLKVDADTRFIIKGYNSKGEENQINLFAIYDEKNLFNGLFTGVESISDTNVIKIYNS